MGNTVNYFTQEGVASLGRGTVVAENVVLAEAYPHPEREPFVKHDRPHQAREFTRDRIQRYIRDLRQ